MNDSIFALNLLKSQAAYEESKKCLALMWKAKAQMQEQIAYSRHMITETQIFLHQVSQLTTIGEIPFRAI